MRVDVTHPEGSPEPLILASSSPRRRELMSQLGLPFTVAVSGIAETVPPDRSPDQMVLDFAEEKARVIAAAYGVGAVVGADTTVVLDGAIMGKPIDPEDAVRMLQVLRDRVHRVYTGLAIVDITSDRIARGLVASEVRMRAYSDDEIARYVATEEPLDKAGSYGIQGKGRAFVADVTGCFNNVVGLPLCEVTRLLHELGVPLPDDRVPCRLADGQPCPRLPPHSIRCWQS